MWRPALLALLLAACGPDLDRPHQGDAGPGRVGAACRGDPDCESELVCFAQLPGGFCSRLCQTSCTTGLCVKVRLADSSEVLACSPTCGQDAGTCRTGYRCVSVGQQSVCSF